MPACAVPRTRSNLPSHRAWPFRCELDSTEGTMLMFKRSQIYIGLGLAAVVEIVIRVVVH